MCNEVDEKVWKNVSDRLAVNQAVDENDYLISISSFAIFCCKMDTGVSLSIFLHVSLSAYFFSIQIINKHLHPYGYVVS